jgi:hypothetical protein
MEDKLERARILHQEAEQKYIDANEALNARTSFNGSTSNWWDDPPVSTPAVGKPADNQFVFSVKHCQKGSLASKMHVRLESFTPKANNIPHFRTYYPIRKSQLVQSDRDLLFWPEATENGSLREEEVKDQLKEHFHFRMEQRVTDVAYTQNGRQWQPYAEAFLGQLNLSEEDMLRFLVDDSYDAAFARDLTKIKFGKGEVGPNEFLKRIRRELRRAPQLGAIQDRVQAWNDEERGFDEMKKLKFRYLALAFYAISSSYLWQDKGPSFNVVYCLIQSPTLDIAAFLRDPKEVVEVPEYTAKTHFDLACRICHL